MKEGFWAGAAATFGLAVGIYAIAHPEAPGQLVGILAGILAFGGGVTWGMRPTK